MSISKTRQLLVDIARQLFAKNGLENTTMNDIAQASGKGRRTLYTYFKSKEDIYYAVIESELERLSDQLDEVAAKRIPPQENEHSSLPRTCENHNPQVLVELASSLRLGHLESSMRVARPPPSAPREFPPRSEGDRRSRAPHQERQFSPEWLPKFPASEEGWRT